MNAEMYDVLIAVGAPEEKARAASIAMVYEMHASKNDVHRVEKELKADIKRTETELKANIQRVETELKADIQRVEKEFKVDIQRAEKELKADIQRVEVELRADIKRVETQVHGLNANMAVVKWMLALVIVATVIPLIKDFL